MPPKPPMPLKAQLAELNTRISTLAENIRTAQGRGMHNEKTRLIRKQHIFKDRVFAMTVSILRRRYTYNGPQNMHHHYRWLIHYFSNYVAFACTLNGTADDAHKMVRTTKAVIEGNAQPRIFTNLVVTCFPRFKKLEQKFTDTLQFHVQAVQHYIARQTR